jgi:hypothetical protein
VVCSNTTIIASYANLKMYNNYNILGIQNHNPLRMQITISGANVDGHKTQDKPVQNQQKPLLVRGARQKEEDQMIYM